jgi:quaternary ammonium compound-resistance protein SugE
VWGSVLAASVVFAIGGAFMTASAGFTRPWPSMAVLLLFGVGAFLLSRAVRIGGLSTAYTVGLGIEAVLSMGLGIYLFGERPSVMKTLSVGLIVAGVAGVRLG